MANSGTARHRRGTRDNSLVYSVMSRRAGGLSIGINLFPERKECSFDCPYCEVLPFEPGKPFSRSALELRLAEEVRCLIARDGNADLVRDICFSGNGEPTLSRHLMEALEATAAVRSKFNLKASDVPIRIITNSTGFLNKSVVIGLRSFHESEGLSIWAKLDAGSDEWFHSISGSSFSLDVLTAAIAGFSLHVPVTIQTMVCRIGDKVPDKSEAAAFAFRLKGMMQKGAQLEGVHIYTISRIPSDMRAQPLPDDFILEYMKAVSDNLDHNLPILGFGANGLLPLRLE